MSEYQLQKREIGELKKEISENRTRNKVLKREIMLSFTPLVLSGMGAVLSTDFVLNRAAPVFAVVASVGLYSLAGLCLYEICSYSKELVGNNVDNFRNRKILSEKKELAAGQLSLDERVQEGQLSISEEKGALSKIDY